MKKFFFILIISCFTIASAFSQEVNRIKVYGLIIVDSVDVEGVTVYNKSANKGTITDSEGLFTIDVALNDRVEISALQFENFVIVINEDIISTKMMTVFLVERINKLDEILILPFSLSGNLNSDMATVKTYNPDLDALYFGIKSMDKYEFTDDFKSGVVNIAMEEGYYYNGADFVQIIGLLVKPIFKSKKKDGMKFTNTYQNLTAKYSLSYLVKNLSIPQDKVNEFVYFVENSGFDTSLMDDGKELQFLEFLVAQSKLFNSMRNDKD
jgi:hypothetical protein